MAGAQPADNGLYPLFTTEFKTNLELLLQQMGSKLRGRVKEGFHVGKQSSPVNQVGPVESKAPAGRFAPKQRTDVEYVRRWVFPSDREIDQLVDNFDVLKTMVDPKSELLTNVGNAFGRDWDDAIIQATTGTAQTGQDASAMTAELFGSTVSTSGGYVVTDTFGAGSSAGMIPAKLIEARRVFQHFHNDLDTDPLTLVIGSQQEADMLNQVQFVSTEYQDRPVLVDGRLKRFLGYDIVVSERLLQTTVGSIRGCIAFVRSGMYLGMWKETTNRVSIANWLSSEPWDLYSSHSFGATRLQLGKVVEIKCADTTGSDITP